jgi:hypothetical protein
MQGEVNLGNEAKVFGLENNIANWKDDVMNGSEKLVMKKDMCAELFQVKNSLSRYWCEGKRTRWVVHTSMTSCWDCMHNPCACNAPLL